MARHINWEGRKLASLKGRENYTLGFLYGVGLSRQGPDCFMALHLWPHPSLVNAFLTYPESREALTASFPPVLERKLENSRQNMELLMPVIEA